MIQVPGDILESRRIYRDRNCWRSFKERFTYKCVGRLRVGRGESSESRWNHEFGIFHSKARPLCISFVQTSPQGMAPIVGGQFRQELWTSAASEAVI